MCTLSRDTGRLGSNPMGKSLGPLRVARGLGMDADVTGASELCQPSSADYSAVWCRRASEDGHVRMEGVRKSSDEVIVSIIHYDVDFEDIDRAG